MKKEKRNKLIRTGDIHFLCLWKTKLELHYKTYRSNHQQMLRETLKNNCEKVHFLVKMQVKELLLYF